MRHANHCAAIPNMMTAARPIQRCSAKKCLLNHGVLSSCFAHGPSSALRSLYLVGISVFNSAFANHPTPASLPTQAQISMASSGWHDVPPMPISQRLLSKRFPAHRIRELQLHRNIRCVLPPFQTCATISAPLLSSTSSFYFGSHKTSASSVRIPHGE